MLEQPEISEGCACLLGEISRTVLHYTPKVRLENEQLQGRMAELVSERAVSVIPAEFAADCRLHKERSSYERGRN
ncbi:hypothetical protein SAMN05216411_11130 [Nitrosospira multiformis]|nr:hypothetical protein SAMN05216411_11130 [Nitrosospira multiformis]